MFILYAPFIIKKQENGGIAAAALCQSGVCGR